MTSSRGAEWCFCSSLENHDRSTDFGQLVDALEILVVESDTAVGHVLAQESRVESAVDEVPFAESEGIFSEHARFDALRLTPRNRQSLLDEGPVRFHPHGVDELRLHGEFAARRVENPLAIGFAGLVENRAAAGRGERVQHHPISPFDVEMVSGRIDHDIRLPRHQLSQLSGKGFITRLQRMERCRIHGDQLRRGRVGCRQAAALSQCEEQETNQARPERECDALHVLGSGFFSACSEIGQGRRHGIVFMEGADDRDGSSLVDPVKERQHL